MSQQHSPRTTVLVTGGTGYIGSHTTVELMQAGFDVVIVDSLANSDACVVDRIEAIVGRRPQLVVADIRDKETVVAAMEEFGTSAVLHFAGVKVVEESCADPLKYYDTNVAGSIRLLQAMAEVGICHMVFSSSTTVYGDTLTVPVTEEAPVLPISPYGRSKLMVESILNDLAQVPGADWRFVVLRYFNPVGAHESGIIGEDPNGIPTNLMPYVCQVALGRLKRLAIFGYDYPTGDGTAIRDFIHVVDLAKGHVAALKALQNTEMEKVVTVNLGTGRGASVLELVNTFSTATGASVPFDFVARRAGDVAISYADVSRANRVLGWKAERDLSAMCRDAWNWQSRNPLGYGDRTSPYQVSSALE